MNAPIYVAVRYTYVLHEGAGRPEAICSGTRQHCFDTARQELIRGYNPAVRDISAIRITKHTHVNGTPVMRFACVTDDYTDTVDVFAMSVPEESKCT